MANGQDDDRGLGRRDALRILGGGTAALAACRPVWEPADRDPTGRALAKPPVPGSDGWATHEERWVASSCAQCPAGCGIRVRVVEGRAVRIEGNRENPLNRGGIGPRGLAGLQALYDPDRLTGPMIRKGGRLQPATWDEAVGLVIDRLRAARGRGEPDKLLVMTGAERGFVRELLARLCRAYGTPHFVGGAPGGGPLAQAMRACLGVDEPPVFDWDGVSCVLSLEAALVEGSCQAVHLSRAAAEGRRGRERGRGRRLRIIHAGPMLDLAALDADEWLRIAPGTSGALALAVCHVLCRDRGAEPGAEFGRFLQGFAPEAAAKVCGLRAEQIEEIALDLAELGPSFAFVDERSVAYSNGRETAQAAFALNALLGAIERPAGGLRLPVSPPLAPWPTPILDEVARAGLDKPPLDEPLAAAIARARFEVALVHQANPTWARHQPAAWREALASVPLVVSFSPYLDETVAEVAGVVLPEPTYLERWEEALPAAVVPRAVVGVRRPVIEPLHDTRPAGDVVIALAHGVGGLVAEAFPWRGFREAMEHRLIGLRAAGEDAFLDRLYERGFWAGPEVASRPATFSFRAEMPEPEWIGDAAHPLRLIAYQPLGYAEGSGANQPWLHMLRDRAGAASWTTNASFHPDSAPGVSDGDRVEITSAWGAISARARLDRRLEPGLVAVPLGGGHTALGRYARGIGANVMELLSPEPAPCTGAPVLCGTRVAVRRIGGGT